MQNQLEQLEKEYGIEWQEYELSKLFEIKNTFSFNKDKLTFGSEYDYVTRTSQNQGILRKTGFVNQENINSSSIWSLGLLQMDFFYRQKPWYAGQFVRKIVPKIELSKSAILYFTVLFNKQKESLLSGLVRDVDNAFLSAKVSLPTKNSQIALDFIEEFISTLNAERVATLNAERVATLNAYLTTTGLKDYILTDAEQGALDDLDTATWGKFKIEDVLVWQKNISELNPLHLDSLSMSDEKKYPFYGQATTNNGIIEYRHLKDEVLNNKLGKPTILIHSNNQNTVYLDTPFYLKDGHGATSVLQSEHLDKMTVQFFMSSIKKVILQKYTYNSKATKIELKNTDINLPVKSDNTPNYDYMSLVISAMQKIVIKNMVDYLDLRIKKTGDIL
jgi:Type I restriction modification DNA specificity domain